MLASENLRQDLLGLCDSYRRKRVVIWAMATKIKGICKSFKFIFQMFVVKEPEMEIGCPTDVKHVAHIGWDSPSNSGPSWMNEFRTSPDFATSSFGNTREPEHANPMPFTTRSTQNLDESNRSETSSNISSSDYPNTSKKNKRGKTKPTSSPRSTTRQSRAARSKITFSEATPAIQV